MIETDLIKAFGAFFAIMNPFVNLPVFLAVTEGFSIAEQRKLAIKIVLFSAIMSVIILIFGQKIISFFGITIDQFRIAGGLVLANIAWSMLNGESVSSHHRTDDEKASDSELSSLAFYPITFPMLVGPGTIATLIVYASHEHGVVGLAMLGAIVAAILAMLFAAFFFASSISKVLSNTAQVITTRLMGMVLLAISVDMVSTGAMAIAGIDSQSS
ncbi:MAG: MarC family protein [Pseudomonadota bacterium]|nr:MarC family protein [Pseudomonadota bacterium]